MQIKSLRRTGVNQLALDTTQGPRLLTAVGSISLQVEKTLRGNVARMGFRAACAGVGRVTVPSSK